MLRSFSLTRQLFPLIFLRFITCVKATTKCGTLDCGENGYCCLLDKNKCCYPPVIYRIWWFWFISILIFMSIIFCFYKCWKSQYRSNNITQPMYAARTYIVGPVPGPYPVWGPQQPYVAYDAQGLYTAQVQPVSPPYNAQAPPYTPNTANIQNTSNTQNAPNSSPN